MSDEPDFSPCDSCGGKGFIKVAAVEHHGSHYKSKTTGKFAIVVKHTFVKFPCDCLAGDRWLERRRQ